MKIEIGEKQRLTFGDVKIGEVFVTEGGIVALKIGRLKEIDVNIVYLDDGYCNNFDDSLPISRIVSGAVLVEK